MNFNNSWGIWSILLFFFISCQKKHEKEDRIVLFERVPSDHTGIDFSNNLRFNQEFNIYTYRNFYNGGGVGLGDINNDGLIDIYLTANQGKNKLYLNKGSLKFEDITERAGVGGNKAWSTGVSMADVNGDGLVDIYVCNSGDVKGDNKQNELFINQGNLVFKESASEFGLDEKGFTTHAAFFDYDRDGDLDAYILNNSYQSIGSFNLRKNERPNRDSLGGDKLLRNDDGFFKDISKEAGIYGSVIGFGLGVTVGDINQDGWSDIYVSNDFFERDYLYINNRDGSFKESLTDYFNSLSAASMGADMADINNDGWPDLFVTEMLPYEHSRIKTVTTFEDWNRYQYNLSNDYYHQFTRNTLQLNNRDNSFSEIGRMIDVEATDWSWGALLFDMDNDGLRDIFVSNGIRQDLTNQDFLQYASSEDFVESVVSKGAVNYKKLVEVIPSYPVPNFAFRNSGNLHFKNVSALWGFDEPNFSNGSAYGDLDNDGDLDLIINHVDQKASLYKNNSREMNANAYLKFELEGVNKNTQAIGAVVRIHSNSMLWSAEQIPTRGFQSSVDSRVNFGLGSIEKVDSIEIVWPSHKRSVLKNVLVNQTLKLFEKDALALDHSQPQPTSSILETSNLFVHIDKENEYNDFDRDRLMYHMITNEGPQMCQGDIDGDGLEDFYIGGSRDEPGRLYVQQRSGAFRPVSEAMFDADKISEDCGCAFFDADADGDSDLYVTSGSNEFPTSSTALLDRLYLNEGRYRFTKSNQLLPTSNFESTSTVAPSDYDGDGDIDLFVGVRVQAFSYGVPVSGYLLENDGHGHFKEVSATRAPALHHIGMITDAIWSDVEGDGDADLLIVGEWMQIRMLINTDGNFRDSGESLGLSHTSGWWNRIVSADLDGDGDTDYVVGNHGLNSRFKASPAKPVSMWVNDFDQNGTIDQILCRWWGDKQYPLALRHDLVSQLPGLKKKYLKYESYKDHGIEDIFSVEERKGSIKWDAEELRSVILFNEGTRFRIEALPIEAQVSPVYGIGIDDYDGDGHQDIILGGNQYRAKPEVGRYDASYGLYLKGDGAGGFKSLPGERSGLRIRGEVRDMVHLRTRQDKLLLISVNSDSLKVFKY